MEDMVMEDMVMVIMAMVTAMDMGMVMEIMEYMDIMAGMATVDMAKIMAIVIRKAIHSLQHTTRVMLRSLHTMLNPKCTLKLKRMKLHNSMRQLKPIKAHTLKIRMKLLHILITIMILKLIIPTKKLHTLILQTMDRLPIMEINHNTKVRHILSNLLNTPLFKILLQSAM